MSSHDLESAHPEREAPELDARARWAAQVRAAWPRVRIDFVEATPCSAGCRVRAVVHLDGLMPVDVVVGVTPGTTSDVAACPPDRRLWSTESLANGCYVFERTIPRAEDVAGDEWTVCVSPAAGSGGRPLVFPLRLAPIAPAMPNA